MKSTVDSWEAELGQMFCRRLSSNVLWMGWGCGFEPKPETAMPLFRKKGKEDAGSLYGKDLMDLRKGSI